MKKIGKTFRGFILGGGVKNRALPGRGALEIRDSNLKMDQGFKIQISNRVGFEIQISCVNYREIQFRFYLLHFWDSNFKVPK